jgi:hypothetical protein
MIPLLSLRSVSKLRCEILDSITRAKVNKMVIMQGLFREYVAQVDDLLYPSGQEPVSEFSRSVHAFNVRYNHFISFHLFIFVSFHFISFIYYYFFFPGKHGEKSQRSQISTTRYSREKLSFETNRKRFPYKKKYIYFF